MTTIQRKIVECMQLCNEKERISSLLSFIREGTFSIKDIVVNMADMNLISADTLSELLSDTGLFGYKPRTVKTILITTANLHYGGGPRVAVNLANAFSQVTDNLGNSLYNVILISDEETCPKDYVLKPSVTRLNIAPRNKAGSYKERADHLYEHIEKESVDLVIQATKRDDDSLWDMLLCKSHPLRPAYIQICHTSFGSMFNNGTIDNFLRRKRLYQYADALVVLNRADRVCWGTYSPRVWIIPNIIDFAPSSPKEAIPSHRVVWSGRITSQKQPFELIKIAKEAVKLLPDIRFDMIGEADNESYINKLKSEIEKQGLGNHVFLLGHRTNMTGQYPYYDLFVHTALYEGFGLVLYEAAAHALPVIMYIIPGLDYKEHLPAIVECEQKDYKQMAREIVDLLTSRDKYAEASASILQQLIAFQKQGQINEWQRLFTHLEKSLSSPQEGWEKDVTQAIDSLVFYHYDKLEETKSKTEPFRSNSTIKKLTRVLPMSIRKLIKAYVQK